MEFRILGPFEVEDGGRVVRLGGGLQRSVLALLALNPREVVSQERLIDELWGSEPPENAAKSLHNQVSAVRRALGDGVIETRPPGYVLELDAESLDAARFERLVEAGVAKSDSALSRDCFREALALWRGMPWTFCGLCSRASGGTSSSANFVSGNLIAAASTASVM